jgi:hypothetical protein
MRAQISSVVYMVELMMNSSAKMIDTQFSPNVNLWSALSLLRFAKIMSLDLK